MSAGQGRRPIPFTRQDIERAVAHTKSNKGAARYLGISLKTYKTAASRFTNEEGKTLYEAHNNKYGKGIPKLTARKNGEPMLMDILEGRVSSQFFSLKRIKERLIEEGYIEHCCNRCGFKEARALDEQIPLILSFRNGNKKDWRLENLEFLCYNCYFINVGDVFEKDQIRALEVHTHLLSKKVTQLELPPQHEALIEKQLDFNNKVNPGEENTITDIEKPYDYADDLISFAHMKRR